MRRPGDLRRRKAKIPCASAEIVLQTGDLHPRTEHMVRTARFPSTGRWSRLRSQALQLRIHLDQQFDRGFNVPNRDDKSYPCLAVTLDEKSALACDAVAPSARACATSVRTLRMPGPSARRWTCCYASFLLAPAQGVYKRRARSAVRVCSGLHRQVAQPCGGPGVPSKSTARSSTILRFVPRRPDHQVPAAARCPDAVGISDAQEYDRAARCLTTSSLAAGHRQQAVVLGDYNRCRLRWRFAQDELEVRGHFVFTFAGGRVRGQRATVVDKLDGYYLPAAGRAFVLAGLLVDGYESPREVLVPSAAGKDLTSWPPADALPRGILVELARAPTRDKRALLETVATQRRAPFAQAQRRAPASDLSGPFPALSECRIRRTGRRSAAYRSFYISNLQKHERGGEHGRLEDWIATQSE